MGGFRKAGKTLFLIIIFIFVAVGGAAILWLRTDYWKSNLLTYLDNKFKEKIQVTFHASDLRGNFFKNIKLRDLEVHTLTGRKLVSIAQLKIDYRLLSLLRKKPAINLVEIDGLRFFKPDSMNSLLPKVKTRRAGPSMVNFDIHRINIHDAMALEGQGFADTLLTSKLITGRMKFVADSNTIQIDTAQVHFPGLKREFNLSKGKYRIYGDSLVIRSCKVCNESAQVSLDGFVKLDSTRRSELQIDLRNFKFTEYLRRVDKVLAPSDYVNIKGRLKTHFKQVDCDLRFDGKTLGKSITNGELAGQYDDGDFMVRSLAFRSGSEKLTARIRGNLDTGFNAEMDIWNLNLKNWGVVKTSTDLTGRWELKAEGKIRNPGRVYSRLALRESTFDTLQFNRVEGAVVYEGRQLSIVDTLFVDLEQTHAKMVGVSDLALKLVDAKAYFVSSDLGNLAIFSKIDSLQGNAEAFVEITGALLQPDFRGWLRGRGIGFRDLRFDKVSAKFGFVNVAENHFADVTITAEDGKSRWISKSIDQADITLRFSEDTTYVRSFQVSGDEFVVSLEAKLVKLQDFFINRFHAVIENDILDNVSPLHISSRADTLRMAACGFSLNDGNLYLEGYTVAKRLRFASASISNLNLDAVIKFVPQLGNIAGIVNGYAEYHRPNGSAKLNMDLASENFRIGPHHFQLLRLGAEIENEVFSIKDFLVQDMEGGFVQGQGRIGCEFTGGPEGPLFRPDDSIDLQLNFDHFQVETFDPYIIKKLHKAGKLTGQLSIEQSLKNPAIEFDVKIDQPIFDRIQGKQLTTVGRYKQDELRFDKISESDEYGSYTGYGYLPLHLGFVPLTAVFERDSSMSMTFSGHTKSMNFLAAYIEGLDDVSGDINLALSISGTPSHPIRSGNINFRNGVLDISSLENQITGIQGSAIISNNIMQIVSFNGYMLKPRRLTKMDRIKDWIRSFTYDLLFPSGLVRNDPNLGVTGTIDFAYFFRPDFDLKLKGDGIYFRTLLAEQEGLIDAEFSMAGRDTINIDAEIDVIELIIRNEFQESVELLEETHPGSIYNIYNLHAMIPGNLYFRNSQLDSELEGEMWLVKHGDEPFQFSGDLEVKRGKFFYYGWEFRDVQGTISFDPVEFNPQLDLSAAVDLGAYGYRDSTNTSGSGSDNVTIRLTGDLEQPSLSFESLDDKYSQSDILMFLTRMQRSVEDGTGQGQLSTDAVNVFGAYFQRQLERGVSRLSGLDEFELRTDGNFASGLQPDQWSMMVGQKLAPNLYITYERSLSLIEPNQQIGVEYRLNRNTSLIGEIDQEGLLKFNYRFKYHY